MRGFLLFSRCSTSVSSSNGLVTVRGCYRFVTNIFFRHLETFIMNTTSLNPTSSFEENSTSMVIPDANLSAVSENIILIYFLYQSLCLGENSFLLGTYSLPPKILDFGFQSAREKSKILVANNAKLHRPPPIKREFSPKCKLK